TTTSTGASCAGAGSDQRSPVARPRTAPAWAATAGSSSGPSRGCTSSNGCSSATTAATTCTKRSSGSAVASSASDDSRTHFETCSYYSSSQRYERQGHLLNAQ